MFPTFLLYLKKATKWWFLPIMVAAGFFVILSAIKNVRYTFTMFTVPGNFSLISKSNRHDCLMAVRVEISVGCRFSPDHDSGFSTGISPFFSLLERQHTLKQFYLTTTVAQVLCDEFFNLFSVTQAKKNSLSFTTNRTRCMTKWEIRWFVSCVLKHDLYPYTFKK